MLSNTDSLLENNPVNLDELELDVMEPYLDFEPLSPPNDDLLKSFNDILIPQDEGIFPFDNLINLFTTDNNATLSNCENDEYLSNDSNPSVQNIDLNYLDDTSNESEQSFSKDVLSVLGVNLNLQYFNEIKSEISIQSELDELINETVLEIDDFNVDTNFEDYLNNNSVDFLVDSNVILEISEINSDDNIIEKFPHIKDQNNIRRRCLLYENCHRNRQRSDFSHLEKNRTVYFKKKVPQEKLPPNNEDKYFTCPMANCDKIYAKTSHLKAHLRRHSGEKPFVCNWKNCSWRFSRSDELARHKRSHSGIKPYKCEMCEKAFARSDHLAKHRNVHRRKMGLISSKPSKRKLQ